jgi:hypothetical protein
MQSQFSIPSRIRRRPPINLCAHPAPVTSEWSSCSKAPLGRYRQGGIVYSGPSSTHLIQYCGHTPPPPTNPVARCAISKTLPPITWLTVTSGKSLFGIRAMRKSFHTRYESYAGTRVEEVSEGEPQDWRRRLVGCGDYVTERSWGLSGPSFVFACSSFIARGLAAASNTPQKMASQEA